MTEASDTGGGFLVEPQRLGVLENRVRAGVLYNLIPKVRVRTDAIEFVSVTEGLSAGWTAELAAKPLGTDLSFSTLQASVFTVAGLAVASNQLLEDSSIDQLLIANLQRRVGEVVEAAILTGSGTGQPRGLLNTPSINDQEYTDATPTVGELLVQIANAIAQVQTNNLTEPTHIIMRPQTWTKIITSADAQGIFSFGVSQSDPGQRTAADPFPQRFLFGFPVVLSGSMPANLATDNSATGTQTRVVVADLTDSLLMIRSELNVDKSEHVYFTSNQTVFRGERRLGFTAAQYPKSIATVSGTGMDTVTGGW
jgi:HK97 family phage major capsid protein